MEKKTSNANKLVLKRILAQEGNGKCADCKTATHPRWASWNIGILICIRCSGIHRSLGTHISKVRSIDLDTWNDMQLEKLVEFGNTKANTYWEAQLPPNYIPDESKIANFIKTKYELKRWIPKDGSLPSSQKQASPSSRPVTAGPPVVPPKIRSGNADLLDLDDAFSLKPAANRTQPTQQPIQRTQPATRRTQPPENAQNLYKSQSTTAFSSPATRSQSAVSELQISRSHQPSPVAAPMTQAPLSGMQGNRADVKKSILSLYSQPSKSSSSSLAQQSSTTNSMSSGYPPVVPQQHQTSSTSSLFGQISRTESQPPLDEDNFASIWN